MATYRLSCASTDAVINTDYVATVGEAVSYFLLSPTALFRLHMNVHLCIHLPFPFMNINDTNASSICFLVILVASTGAKVSRTCRCVSSFVYAASPHSLNLFSPVLVHIVS